MNNYSLTVEDAAKLANLHPKTILRFIKENKIKAKKIGRQWRVNQDDINSFLGVIPDSNDTAYESSLTFEGKTDLTTCINKDNKVQVSTVIDIMVKDINEASRLSNTFIALLNCKDPDYGNSSYKFVFYEKENKARFILWGTPLFISKILLLVSDIASM